MMRGRITSGRKKEMARQPPSRVTGVSTYNLVVVPKPPVTDVTLRTQAYAAWDDDVSDESGELDFKRLTREEAQQLRESRPQVNPWQVVLLQAAVGLLLVGVGVLVWGWGATAKSMLYGVAAVVVPNVLLIRGTARFAGLGAVVVMFRFLLWEFVKIGAAVLMLAVAPKVVPELSWPALLIALFVCIKVNWLALLWQGRVKSKS